jgi:RNA polymerase sigma-70 factor (ECF subfamily)
MGEDDARRIYGDALARAFRHAAIHLPRDEAREAAHLVAAALVRRHENGAAFAAIESLDAFIHQAVISQVRHMWRAAGRRAAAEAVHHDERARAAPAWVRADVDFESREMERLVDRAIADLPQTQRQVFLLIRRDERSYRDVAAQLGVGVGTVHTHLSRANAALRRALAEYQAAEHVRTFAPPDADVRGSGGTR